MATLRRRDGAMGEAADDILATPTLRDASVFVTPTLRDASVFVMNVNRVSICFGGGGGGRDGQRGDDWSRDRLAEQRITSRKNMMRPIT